MYLKKASVVIVALLFSYYIFSFCVIRHFDNVRINNIRVQVKLGQNNLIIKNCPLKLIWNYNPNMEFHQKSYIRYLKYRGILNEENEYTITLEDLDRKRYLFRGW